MIKRITCKWLTEEYGCIDGVEWFRKEFPRGLLIDEENIMKLVTKLWYRKSEDRFSATNLMKMDTLINMSWLFRKLLYDSEDKRYYNPKLFDKHMYYAGHLGMQKIMGLNALRGWVREDLKMYLKIMKEVK